ncbi:MAG: hypothetical protein LBR52_00625 [Prevotellaceae bacterium]|jgi:hypothetical protein|nr:hypothetical protein [Prevotellaceae bacterium]
MEKNNEQQELDLFSLLEKTGNFLYGILKKIAGFFGYLLQLTFRYYYVFFLFMFAAAAYSYYVTHGARRLYKAEFRVILNDGDLNTYSEIISSLNRYLENRDSERFDDLLQIPPQERGKVGGIFHSVVEGQDSVVKNTIIGITVGISSPEVFPTIEKALIDYFKRNDHFNSLNAVRIASLKERERILEKDIAAIDSLQKIEYFQKTNESVIKVDQKMILKTEKQMFYADKLKLLEEKEAVSKELATQPEVVTVVSEFLPSLKPYVSMRHVIVKYVLAAFLLFLFLALLWDNRKSIISYLRKKDTDLKTDA